MSVVHAESIVRYFRDLQDDICRTMEAADGGGRFREDLWKRPGGGGGRTRILEGRRIEKGGVNFSAVEGEMPERAARSLEVSPGPFLATGVSIVLHPVSPRVPIIHMNVRFFELKDGLWWFGGGIDLTPHYVDVPQAAWFHRQLRKVCDRHHPDFYSRFKDWADEYFYLKHRQETRGVGGIFFDRLREPNRERAFAFVRDVGEAFAPLYTHLLRENQDLPYGEKHEQWQRLRRGRYVEFNLVWDRGTQFGLDTGGRTESILMSLPPLAAWQYDHRPEADSEEAHTLAWLRKGVDWTGLGHA